MSSRPTRFSQRDAFASNGSIQAKLVVSKLRASQESARAMATSFTEVVATYWQTSALPPPRLQEAGPPARKGQGEPFSSKARSPHGARCNGNTPMCKHVRGLFGASQSTGGRLKGRKTSLPVLCKGCNFKLAQSSHCNCDDCPIHCQIYLMIYCALSTLSNAFPLLFPCTPAEQLGPSDLEDSVTHPSFLTAQPQSKPPSRRSSCTLSAPAAGDTFSEVFTNTCQKARPMAVLSKRMVEHLARCNGIVPMCMHVCGFRGTGQLTRARLKKCVRFLRNIIRTAIYSRFQMFQHLCIV